MTTQHTPGPWATRRNIVNDVYAIEAQDGSAVCYGTVAEANAQLIAAAPDLLAALERCFEFLDTNFDELDMRDILEPAGEALTKARGPNATRALLHRDCGHSSCGQHFIDTGETACIEPDPDDRGDWEHEARKQRYLDMRLDEEGA